MQAKKKKLVLSGYRMLALSLTDASLRRSPEVVLFGSTGDEALGSLPFASEHTYISANHMEWMVDLPHLRHLFLAL